MNTYYEIFGGYLDNLNTDKKRKKNNFFNLSDNYDEKNVIKQSDFQNNLLSRLESMSSQQICIIILIGIILFYVFFKIDFSSNFFKSLILSFVIIYVYISKMYSNNQKILESENLKIYNTYASKYKYLFLNIKIINIYNKLSFIKDYNKTSYKNSLIHMNNFFKKYFEIKKKYSAYTGEDEKIGIIFYNKIENSVLHLKESLNALMSVSVSLPINLEINGIPINKYLEAQVKEIFKLSNDKLMEIIQLYNLKWKNANNINRFLRYIDINSAEPNPLNSIDYLPNYNLY